VAILVVLALFPLSAMTAVVSAETDAFLRTWQRTDFPVQQQAVSRSWIWGPLGTAHLTTESYVEAPGGQRAVMYFDKARMEDNSYRVTSEPWNVTNGLLVVELISGNRQVGDNSFQAHQPANVPVAGDPDDATGPTYASFSNLLGATVSQPTDAIVRTVDRNGAVSANQSLATHAVGAHHYVAITNHWVADPFWAFMTSSGTVWENEQYVTDTLFEDPYYGTGLPITEAYWARVKVAGTVQDVLVQCFERRCLTYTPGNVPAWRVEMGNVGQHYYRWRYGHDIPGSALATAYLIALGDNGQSGILVGCQDSLIAITIPIWPTGSTEERIEVTLSVLLSYHDEYFGESGLYNALYRNTATVDSVTVAGGVATVNLTGTIPSGGVCDDPRIVGQLEQTVLAVPGITDVVLRLNGQPLFPV
jgi:hypothetical protein